MEVSTLLVKIEGDGSGGVRASRENESALDSLGRKAEAELSRFDRVFSGMGRAASTLLSPLKMAGGAVSSMVGGIGHGLATFGLAGQGINMLGGTIRNLSMGLISGNAAFEGYQTQFGVLLKGTDSLAVGVERAKVRIADLSKFAATTPFELPEVVQAGRVLESFGLQGEKSMKRFGLSTKDVLTVVGDAASGSGANFQELAMTFGKFASGATGDAIMRLQELGIATKEQMKGVGIQFSKAGALVTPVDEAFKKMVGLVKSHSSGMMAAQSLTLDGMLSNLSDWKGTAIRTMAAPIFDHFKEGVSGLLTFLGSDRVMNGIKSFGEGLGIFLDKSIRVGTAAFHLFRGPVEDVIGLFTRLGSIVRSGVEGAATRFKPLADAFSSVAGIARNTLTPALKDVFGGNMAGGIEKFKSGLSGLTNTGMDLGNFGESIKSQVEVAFRGASEKVQQWAPRLQQYFGQAFDFAETEGPKIISGVLNWAGTFTNDLLKKFVEFGPIIGQAVGEWLPRIIEWLGTGQVRFIQFWGTLFTKAINGLSEILPTLLTGLGGFLVSLFNGLSTGVPAAVSSLLRVLGTIFTETLPGLTDALGNLLGSIGSWIQENGPSYMGQIGDSIKNMFSGIGDVLSTQGPSVADAGGKFVMSLLDSITTNLPLLQEGIYKFLGDAASNIGTFLANNGPGIQQGLTDLFTTATNWLGENVPILVGKIGEMVGTMAGNFGTFVAEKGPGIMEGLGKLLGGIGDWIFNVGVPGLVTMLGSWIDAFVQWVPKGLPPLLSQLGGFIGGVLSWIVEQLPGIAGKLLEWAGKFVEWVGPMIPKVIGALGELLGTLGGWIVGTALPAIGTKLGEWARAFGKWVGDGAAKLVAALPGMWNTLSNWLANTATNISTGVAKWANSVASWIGTAISELPGKLVGIWNGISSWITTTSTGIFNGVKVWISSFFGWVTQVLSDLPAKLGGIWSGITTWIGSTAKSILDAVVSIGSNIVTGIWNGVSGAWQNFINYLSSLVKDNLPQYLKDWLGIKSPSTVMQPIGANMIHGLTAGAKSATPALHAQVKASVLGAHAVAKETLASTTADLVKQATDLINSVTSTMSGLKGIGDFQRGAGWKSAATSFLSTLDDFLVEINRHMGLWQRQASEQRAKVAGYVGDEVTGLTSAVDPLMKLGSKDWKAPSRGAINSLFSALDIFVVELGKRAAGWAKLATEAVANTSKFVGDAVGGILATVDPIQKLASTDMRPLTERAADTLFAALDLLTDRLNGRISVWWGRYNDASAAVAESVGKAVSGILGALEPIQKLASTDMKPLVQSAVDTLFAALDMLTASLNNRISLWWGRFNDTTATIADSVGKAVSGILSAFDSLQKLVGTPLKPLAQAAVDVYMAALDLLTDALNGRISEWWGRYNATSAGVADSVGKAVSGLLSALDPIQKLVSTPLKALTQGAVDTYFGALDLLTAAMQDRISLWWGRFDATTATIAESVGKAVSGLLGAVSGLTALTTFKAAPREIVTAFFSVLDQVLDLFGQGAALFQSRVGPTGAAIAESIGKLVAGIGQAVAPLLSLAGFKRPSVEAINDFYTSLGLFLHEFDRRAADFAQQAGTVAADLAVRMGTIGSSLQKIFDPLLKVGEVQKIDRGQIEGAMANLHFLLYQLEIVRTGLPSGWGEVAGKFMQDVEAVATGISSMFNSLKGATEAGKGIDTGAIVGIFAGMGAAMRTLLTGDIAAFKTEMDRDASGSLANMMLLDWDHDGHPGTALSKLFTGALHNMGDAIVKLLPIQIAAWKKWSSDITGFISAVITQIGLLITALGMIPQGVGLGQGQQGPGGGGGGGGGAPPPEHQGGGGSGGMKMQGLVHGAGAQAYATNSGGSSSGGGQQIVQHIHNPVYIDGMEIQDGDLHKRLTTEHSYKVRRQSGVKVGSKARAAY